MINLPTKDFNGLPIFNLHCTGLHRIAQNTFLSWLVDRQAIDFSSAIILVTNETKEVAVKFIQRTIADHSVFIYLSFVVISAI